MRYFVNGNEERTVDFREVYVAKTSLDPSKVPKFNLGLFSKYGHKKNNAVAILMGPVEAEEDARILCKQGYGSHIDKHCIVNENIYKKTNHFYTNCITNGEHNPFPKGLDMDKYCIATRDSFVNLGLGGCFINTSWGKPDAKINCLRCTVKLKTPYHMPMKHNKKEKIHVQYATVFYAKDDIPAGAEFFGEYKGVQLAYLDNEDFLKPYPSFRPEPIADSVAIGKENFFERTPEKEKDKENMDDYLQGCFGDAVQEDRVNEEDVAKLCRYVHKMVFESSDLFNRSDQKGSGTIYRSKALKRKTQTYFLHEEDMRDGYTDYDNALDKNMEELFEHCTESDGKYKRMRMEVSSQVYTREDLEEAKRFLVDPPQWTV